MKTILLMAVFGLFSIQALAQNETQVFTTKSDIKRVLSAQGTLLDAINVEEKLMGEVVKVTEITVTMEEILADGGEYSTCDVKVTAKFAQGTASINKNVSDPCRFVDVKRYSIKSRD